MPEDGVPWSRLCTSSVGVWLSPPLPPRSCIVECAVCAQRYVSPNFKLCWLWLDCMYVPAIVGQDGGRNDRLHEGWVGDADCRRVLPSSTPVASRRRAQRRAASRRRAQRRAKSSCPRSAGVPLWGASSQSTGGAAVHALATRRIFALPPGPKPADTGPARRRYARERAGACERRRFRLPSPQPVVHGLQRLQLQG